MKAFSYIKYKVIELKDIKAPNNIMKSHKVMLKLFIKTLSYIRQSYKVILKLCINLSSYIEPSHEAIKILILVVLGQVMKICHNNAYMCIFSYMR